MGQDPSDRKRKSLCESCCDCFPPHPRLGERQKTCGKEACRKTHRARYRRRYRRENRKEEQEYQSKRRPNYWKRYRANHPAYVLRNRAASRLRKKLQAQGLQRQLDIVQVAVSPKKLEAFGGFATSHRSLLRQCFHRPTSERRASS